VAVLLPPGGWRLPERDSSFVWSFGLERDLLGACIVTTRWLEVRTLARPSVPPGGCRELSERCLAAVLASLAAPLVPPGG
jgi:hypothetical protein